MQTITGIHLPHTLKFVSSDDDFSTYLTAGGEEVYLAHGTGQMLVGFFELDLPALWSESQLDPRNAYRTSYGHREAFLTLVRSRTIDPDIAEEIRWCNDCGVPGHEDDMCGTNNGDVVCDSCSSQYYECAQCDERYRYINSTMHGSMVCDHCRDEYFTWCEDCDGYYHDRYADEHQHDGCGCESPAGLAFTIRNDGQEPLANDTRVTVTLPAGVISAEGIGEIAYYLRYVGAYDNSDLNAKMHGLSYRLDELGDKWQAKEGNYTKRLSRFAYKEFGLKLTPEVVSKVGNIASAHSTAVDLAIEVTRNLNLSAEEFAHEDSCWWQSYSSSRCALKSNGGFGLRTFDGHEYVSGRAWVMPLRLDNRKRLVPTFEAQEPDAFVVFNGYGDLEGYKPARIVSHMAGMTYRKIGFSGSPMYVNSDSGYLVTSEEIASNYTDGELCLSLDQHSNLFANEKKVLANV